MIKVEIFFRHLTASKQAELLRAVDVSSPDAMNWDIFPLDTLEFEPEPE